MRVFCVLKSGGDFNAGHVAMVKSDLAKHAPGHDLWCISDVDVPCHRYPMEYNWPGWWSKMELFRPCNDGDIFFLDLDTVLVRSIEPLLKVGKITMLADFFRPHVAASGLMYLPESCRAQVWERWIQDPVKHMAKAGRQGDQGFLRETICNTGARWQKEFPGQVISYKVHIANPRGRNVLPTSARVVCFHGTPRPASVNAPWNTHYEGKR